MRFTHLLAVLGALVVVTPVCVHAENRQVIDLIEMARNAKWEASGQNDFVFGKDQLQVSLADYRYDVEMTDKRVYAKTLYTPVQTGDYPTTIRGRFGLQLPKAERIRFVCSAHGKQNWMHHMAIGYVLPETPFKVTYLKDIQLQGIRDGVGGEYDEDITFLAGRDVELVLKTQAEASSTAGLICWTKAQVVCDFPEARGFDLSLSPSDIRIDPQPAPDAVRLTLPVRNVGTSASPPFTVTIGGWKSGRQFAVLNGSPVAAGASSVLAGTLPTPTNEKGWYRLAAQVQAEEDGEAVTANNDAHFTVLLPLRPVLIKRLEGLPRPWKAKRLQVTLDNALPPGDEYTLSYAIADFWGTTVAENQPMKLPRKSGIQTAAVDLGRCLRGRLGWFEAQFTLKRGPVVVDRQAISISRIPPRPAVLSPIMGINHQFWVSGKEDIQADLELVRDLGARYVRCNGPEQWEQLYAQGNGEYVLWYVVQYLLDDIRKSGWTEELEKKCYQQAFEFVSQHQGKVKVYELGNEFNGAISAEDCAKAYRTVYKAAKAADPGCTVNTLGAGGGGPGVVEWYTKLYELAGDCIDNISLHPYTFCAPDIDGFLMKGAAQAVDNYTDILKRNNVYPQKRVWCTEYGWFAAGNDRAALHDQAMFTVRQYLLGAGNGIPMLQYPLKDMGYDTAPGCCSEGLVHFNREPKPAYAAFAVLASRLPEAEFAGARDIGKNSYLYRFRQKGKEFAFLWKSTGPDELLTLPAAGTAVTLTDMMGEVRTLKASSAQTADVPLTTYPVCVEGLDAARFSVRDRKAMSHVPLADTPDGAEFLQQVQKARRTRAWVWWGVCEKLWRDRHSLPILRECIRRASDDLAPGREERPPTEQLVICKRLSTVQVDGDLAEWQGLPAYEGRSIVAARSEADAARNDQDLSYAFRTAWDDERIYFAVAVTDENVHNDQAAALVYNEDAVELWFSALNNKTTSLGFGDAQYTFGVEGQEYDTVSRLANGSAAKTAVKKSPGGYVMEIAVPLSELMLSHLEAGHTIGSEIGVDDSDTQAGRDCQMLHFATTADVFCNPSTWGNLRFER